MNERELLSQISLTTSDGNLNREAVGWARRPLVDTSGIGGRHSWGRNKRWEYWNITTPTHILALTVSSLDYAAVHEVWIFDRGSRQVWSKSATVVPTRGIELPPSLNVGPVRARAKGLAIDLVPNGNETRLQAKIAGASFDVTVTRPTDHDCLAVVVPWSDSKFQYTVKDVALPAAGSVVIDGSTFAVEAGESWAVLDHGRGRWPYDITWNWGAGSGRSGGRVIGVQVGGKWADGTGCTENGLLVDGHFHKISEELEWEYDTANWARPWRVHGGGLDATLTPFYDKVTRTNLGVLASSTDQCFGHWSGSFRTTLGDLIRFDDIVGWAEHVHNRW